MHEAGRVGGLTTPGGIVFLEPAHLAAATRFRGIGRGWVRRSEDGKRSRRTAGTSASLNWNARRNGSRGSWSKPKRSSRSKKSLHAIGDSSEEPGPGREQLMEAAEKFSTELGTAPACRAFGGSRASLYRRRQRAAAPAAERARPRSHRALSGADRQEVLDLLHSGRFVDQVPAQVCAALLDARPLFVLGTHDVPDSGCEPRSARTAEPTASSRLPKPELLATGPNEVWTWDITKLKGPRKVDLLLLVRDSRYLQPPSCGMDGGRLRIGDSGQKVDPVKAVISNGSVAINSFSTPIAARR